MVKYKRMIDKTTAYCKKNGVRKTLHRIYRKLVFMRPADYGVWLENQRLSAKEREALQRQYANVCTETEVCESLTEAWQTEKAYIVVIQKNGRLEADALPLFAQAVLQQPETELFYCDSDRLMPDGTHMTEPLFKPEFDDALLEEMAYVDGGFLVKKELLKACEKEAAQIMPHSKQWAYELFLICSRKSGGAYHLPKMLYHAPADGEILYRNSQLPPHGKTTLVSVLIPNKDHAQMLKTCIESIHACAGDVDYEILILENNSQEPETFAYYRELEQSGRVRVLYWKKAFNYSAVNNYGAFQAKGEYLLFLNNDTEMKSKDCLARLLEQAQRPNAGAVGAKLWYPDGTVQHAGVILGYGGIAGHVFEGMTADEEAQIPWSRTVRQYSAVTAACMLVKKEVFAAAGGFDENLGIAYNDIDLCLRIRALGKKILYTPYAQLIHYESATRGLELTREKAQRVKKEADFFCTRWKKELAASDPFYHPALTLEKNDYSLQR